MAGLTQYGQKKLLDHLLDVAAYTAPSPSYLSLHTSSPGETGSLVSEVSGSAYARQSLASAFGATTLSTGIMQNSAIITFPTATGSWGTVTYLGFMDALTSGNMTLYGAPAEPRNIGSGQILQFVATQISIRFD